MCVFFITTHTLILLFLVWSILLNIFQINALNIIHLYVSNIILTNNTEYNPALQPTVSQAWATSTFYLSYCLFVRFTLSTMVLRWVGFKVHIPKPCFCLQQFFCRQSFTALNGSFTSFEKCCGQALWTYKGITIPLSLKANNSSRNQANGVPFKLDLQTSMKKMQIKSNLYHLHLIKKLCRQQTPITVHTYVVNSKGTVCIRLRQTEQ